MDPDEKLNVRELNPRCRVVFWLEVMSCLESEQLNFLGIKLPVRLCRASRERASPHCRTFVNALDRLGLISPVSATIPFSH